MKALVLVLVLATAAAARRRLPHERNLVLNLKDRLMKSEPGDRSRTVRDSARVKRAACEMTPTNVTAAEKEIYLTEHNKYRAQVGASNMYKLEWDDTLAGRAQAWADQCRFREYSSIDHDCDGDIYGQNIALQSLFNATSIVEGFYMQGRNYNYSNFNACPGGYGYCNMYIQLVWAATTKIGCGYTLCPHEIYQNVILSVCNYSPGVTVQYRPYELGTPCSKCTSPDDICTNGLCNADCSDCFDLEGADACALMIDHCEYGKYVCKKTCGYCRPGC